MTYTAEHLSFFIPLTDKSKCDGTAYIELYPADRSEDDPCWLDGSLFVKDAAFDFVTECFYGANQDFDYFAFVRFSPSQIVRLLQEIRSFGSELSGNPGRNVVFSRYSSLFSRDTWSEVPEAELARRLHSLLIDMEQFIAAKTAKSKCLWVLGM